MQRGVYMDKWDKDDKVMSADISNKLFLFLIGFSIAFLVGLFWGYSIGLDQVTSQLAFGEEIKQITLNESLHITDRITTNVTRGTGVL